MLEADNKHRKIEPASEKDSISANTQLKPEEKPLTLPAAFLNALKSFHNDESSGFIISESAEQIANSTLGNKIAPGLFVSELGKVPRFHLLDTPAKSTLKDFDNTQNALLACITRHQHIEGITPSKNALRVMVLMLRNLPDISFEDSKLLRNICKQAAKIDLHKPENKDWNSEHTIKIKGSSMRVRLSLHKNDPATILITKLLGSDIPMEHRGNKYSYCLDLSKSSPDKTKALQKVEHARRRIYAVGLATVTPMAAGWLTLELMPKRFNPVFSNINSIQSLAEFGIGTAALFASGFIAYHFINTRLQKNRHK